MALGEVITPPIDNLKCPFRYFCFPKGLLYTVPWIWRFNQFFNLSISPPRHCPTSLAPLSLWRFHSFHTELSVIHPCLLSVQFSHSVVSDSVTPMNCSTPGLPVHHQLPEFTQTHVHRVSDAIQPSHHLSSLSPPAPNPSQHQGFFQWISSSYEVAKVLEFRLQHQSFQWTPRTDFLQDGLVGSPCHPRDSQQSSPTLRFKIINSSALSFIHGPTLTSIHDHWKNRSLN